MNTLSDYKNNLRQVGIALLALGLIDIGAMIYCVIKGISYSSSFNIFAVIAGIFLYRGSPKSARIVGFFSAFLLAGFSSLILFFMFTTPFELIWLRLKLETGSRLGTLFVFALLAFLFWVYKRLTRPDVLEATREALGKPVSKFRSPRAGLLYGLGLAVFLAILMTVNTQGHLKEKAIEMAKKQVGTNYKFHISGVNKHSYNGTAQYDVDVTAYSSQEIKDVPVKWDE